MTSGIRVARKFRLEALLLLVPFLQAQNGSFHNAPASAKALQNPYRGQGVVAGKQLFQANCSSCHAAYGEGMGNVPSLNTAKVKAATAGEVFWFITKGDIDNGMPSWAKLPPEQRWQIVSFVQGLGAPLGATGGSGTTAIATAAALTEPPPQAPFTDFRHEKPGRTRKITLIDLPEPFATPSASNGPKLVARPEGVWPQVPDGFKVEQYAADLDDPRQIRRAPNGDLFVTESNSGEVRIFRGITKTGKPEVVSLFATGLNRPFGVNFYPPGADPHWVYVGNTDSIIRFPYLNGDLKARGAAEHVADVPGGDSHWTRDIVFTPDGKKMLVSVGSASNVDDPDTTPAEKNRANILEFNVDGSEMRVFSYGIRNPVGMAINPKTEELWTSVNERDGLGDNLVPDYITHVKEGGFYGWPWWYMGGHQDPRHLGTHPELKDKVIAPDVILNPHNATLGIAFYDGKQFPEEYQNDLFASEHGSWNRATRVGYEVIRVPLHQNGHASGEYEDFMTGFVVDSGHVWGRPVGAAVAADGSLMITDDGSKSVWRISYVGHVPMAENSGITSKPVPLVQTEGRSAGPKLRSPVGSTGAVAMSQMQFSDQPSFAIAGVTDPTAVGGHGSDSSLRTSESLAKDTAYLGGDDSPKDQNLSKKRLLIAREQLETKLHSENTAESHRLLADINEKLNDPVNAARDYETAVALDPSEQNYFSWGSELLLHHAIQPAIEVFSKGSTGYPRSARMLAGLGAALFARGFNERAANCFCQASDLDPDNIRPYLLIGKLEKALPDQPACIEPRLARFAAKQPNNSRANYYYAISVLKSDRGSNARSQEAEELLHKALAGDPNNADVYLELGILYSQRKDGTAEVNALERAVQLNADLAEAHYRLGRALRQTGNVTGAQAEFEAYRVSKQKDATEFERERRELQEFVIAPHGQPD